MASRQEKGMLLDDKEQGRLTSVTNPNRSMEDEYGSDCLESNDSFHRRDDTVVDQMDYEKLGKLLKKLNMNVTTVDKDKIKLKQRLFGGPWTKSFSQEIKDGLSETVRRYQHSKQKLLQHYSGLIATAEDEFFKTNMSALANSRYPDYEKELKCINQKLKNMTDEFEIALIGETSSGKSTFLNVLLGENILPSDHLHKTASLCRLRNSENRKIKCIARNNIVEEIPLTTDSSELTRLLDTINQKIMSDENDDEHLKEIDVYWPIASLHENIVLVDTPGTGEREPLTKQVLEYLPNCAGYIFIIDSSHAGGVRDSITNIIKMIAASASKGNSKIDFSNTIFVCNKWDQIKPKDRKNVLEYTEEKISKYIGYLEDWQIVQINAKLELKLIEWKANSAGDFKVLQKSLNSLMIRTIEKRSGDLCRGLQTFLKEVGGFVNAMINGAEMSEEEFEKTRKKAKDEIHLTKKKLEHFKEVEKMVDIEEKSLLNELQKYLETKDAKGKIFNWTNDVPQLIKVDEEGPELIAKRLQEVMFEWATDETGSLKQASHRIAEKCKTIQDEIDSSISDINELELGFSFVDKSDQRVNLSGKCSAISNIRHRVWELAVSIFSWIGTNSLYDWALDKAREASEKRSIEKMTAMTLNATEKFLTEKQLRNFITESFTCRHINWLTESKNKTEGIIDSASKTIEQMKTKLDMSKDTLHQFKRLQTELNERAKSLQDLEKDI